MTLYHTQWCPECALVREKLAERGIAYKDVIVQDFRPFRKQVYEVSGQYYVPVLVDGKTVLTETDEILEYVEGYPFPSPVEVEKAASDPSS